MSRNVKGRRRFVSAICLAILALVTLIMIFLTIKLAPMLTDSSTQNNNHVVSGNLQLGANIVKQEGESIRGGKFQEWEDRTRVNLQEYSAPIFNFHNATPGTWQRATIEVTNLATGRDAIGFTYKVRIIELKGSGEDGELSSSDRAMASQIKVTVVRADGTTHVFNLIDCSKPENDVELGSIDVGGELEFFSIKIEIPNLSDNNSLMGGELTFDLQIVATQYLPNGTN
ncbi:MAG: hypothetical protein J6V68_01180 [Clostridia bacterium]|nr:hypothetical protein [Clostridia bacterium]